jgi:hypothetical protein
MAVCDELDLSGVEMFDHRVVHLAAFEMTLQGLVGPTPYPLARTEFVGDLRDSDAQIEPQTVEAGLK